jgi:hypothetical protein
MSRQIPAAQQQTFTATLFQSWNKTLLPTKLFEATRRLLLSANITSHGRYQYFYRYVFV